MTMVQALAVHYQTRVSTRDLVGSNHRRAGWLIAMGLSMTGCPSFVHAPGPLFVETPPREDTATVYFFRPPHKMMSDYPINMAVPESEYNCLQMDSGGYTAYAAPAGTLSVIAGGFMGRYIRYTIDIRPGETRYLKVDYNDDEHPQIWELPSKEAEPLLHEMHGIVDCIVELRGVL